MEKGIQCKWKSKEGLGSNSYIRQNRLLNKDCYKRQRRTLHNDQRINPRRKYNNCKYICTQHINTKQILTDTKGKINSKNNSRGL